MSEIIKQNRVYLVKSEFGGYTFNNKKSAEQLHHHLKNYEKISKLVNETDNTLDKVQKEIIQLQMNLSVLQEDLNKIKEAVLEL